MAWLNFFKRTPKPTQKRSYAGAAVSHLFSKWAMAPVNINQTLFQDLQALRTRSRDLCMNNAYASRYIGMVIANVVGEKGMMFQPMTLAGDGKLDQKTNTTLRDSWSDFCLPQNCSLDGRQNFIGMQESAQVHIVRDGECFVRLHKSNQFKYGLKLQIIDPDNVDVNLNHELSGGRRITMGIELDTQGIVQAYYIKTAKEHPDATYVRQNHYVRVPASEMLHLGRIERPGQLRFAPWLAPVMTKLKQLDGFIEAEIIAARIASCKSIFFTQTEAAAGNTDPASALADEKTDRGEFIENIEPGATNVVPDGYQMNSFNPTHPNGNYAEFVGDFVRTMAMGLNVSAHSFSGNLKGMSWSSGRMAAADERDHWRSVQAYLRDFFCLPIYNQWLETALLTGLKNLNPINIDNMRRVTFRGRGFAYVDPVKEIQADMLGVQLGVKTRTEICQKLGTEFNDVVAQLADEKATMQAAGVEPDEIERVLAQMPVNTDDQEGLHYAH